MPKYLMATVVSGLGLIGTGGPLIAFVFHMLATESTQIAGQVVYGDWLMLVDRSASMATLTILVILNMVITTAFGWWADVASDKLAKVWPKEDQPQE